jgi:hypothetical protein
MKRLLAAVAALAFLAVAAPALAQNRDDHNRDSRGYDHNNRPVYHQRMAPPPRRRVVYHENQVWNGHHMHYYGGHWGYYQPRNGANVFINIPL